MFKLEEASSFIFVFSFYKEKGLQWYADHYMRPFMGPTYGLVGSPIPRESEKVHKLE